MSKEQNGIDWHAQWAAHAPRFSNGLLPIDLTSLGISTEHLQPSTIYLEPGPGFGDLSHPTTRLVLKMMARHVRGKHLVDIGCGSGILTACALAMGALSADGIDIDPLALEHAQSNLKRNGLNARVHFYLPPDYSPSQKTSELVILMNMIRSEQREAWSSLPTLHSLPATLITSGILATERALYLQQGAKWGWTYQEETQEGEWLCIRFILV